MKLATRYNRVNIITSTLILLVTGIIYYLVIHLILTNKLDKDLAVEENEIRQYAHTYNRLPLPATFIDQQIFYGETIADTTDIRRFSYTTYHNPKENDREPGRMLVTTVAFNGKHILVTIIKSRVEAEDLVRIILLITLAVTVSLLIVLLIINRFVMSRLWQPFYIILKRMKGFEITKMENITEEPTKIDEFNELKESVNAMAERVRKDYKELKSFTDNASHEMMTPLAVINSKLDSLLQTGTFTAQQSALMEDVYQATGRLSRLHQSLLLLTKIENNLIANTQNLNLKELIEFKIRQFEELFERDALTVNLTLENKTLNMSKYLADILLNNLFSNAVRHNIKNGIINVSLNQSLLRISNSGKKADVESNLFDRFSKSVESEGMGLGLAITKQVCNLYNFEINYAHADELHVFTIYFTQKV